MRWAVKISAPDDQSGDVWGDVFFADDLAVALRRRGQEVYVDRLGTRLRPDEQPDDVVINLRGYFEMPIDSHALNILWVISHPEWVLPTEVAKGYDSVFAASELWARRMADETGVSVLPLLQATNPERFHPGERTPALASEVLFVGKSRNIFRPIVRDAIAIGAPLAVYGDNWEQFIPAEYVRADFLGNADVPAAYRSAEVVLNDHWEDMRLEGFLSNRLFDAVASGARVVSDSVGGLTGMFRGSVIEYSTADELRQILASPERWPDEAVRRSTAAWVAEAHSFDARADALIDSALRSVGLGQG
jgi:hypothetical protein